MKTVEIDQRQPVAILAYHSLDDSGSVLSTSPRIFAEHMRILSELDADVVRITDIGRRKDRHNAAKPAVAITFDDGFRNVYEHGFPILHRYGFPVTVFLVTDYCGWTNSWPSQPAGIVRQPLLSWSQIKEMNQAGIAFGSHTQTHPNLTKVPARATEQELVGSKRAIEDALGAPVDTFAYPYGAYHDRVKELTRTHFALACATTLGFVHPGSDSYALERLDMYYFQRPRLMRHLFSQAVSGYVRARGILRGLRAGLLSPSGG
jgi:peptidoglycan/xylan/chitin deacetylase (PgdA/CDA1 family)